MAAKLKPFQREAALSAVGLLATAVAFAMGAQSGWRVLGGFMIVMAAWVVFTRQAAFLLPGLTIGHLTGKNAVAAAVGSAGIGFAILVNANALAHWTHRACHALQIEACVGDPVCVNDRVVSVTSPARSIRAVKFVRSCDGAKGVATHVSIVPVGQPLPNEPGNAFIVEGEADLLLLWIDGKHVAVSGAGHAVRQLQKGFVNGVRISYEERPR